MKVALTESMSTVGMAFMKQQKVQLLCSKWLQNSLSRDTSHGVKADIRDISFPRQHNLTEDTFMRI